MPEYAVKPDRWDTTLPDTHERRCRAMNRKRFIKLLMGVTGCGRDWAAHAASKRAPRLSYHAYFHPAVMWTLMMGSPASTKILQYVAKLNRKLKD